jgi:hypothetical protein
VKEDFERCLRDICDRSISFFQFPFKPLPTASAYDKYRIQMYDLMKTYSESNEQDKIVFGKAVFPAVKNDNDKIVFFMEAQDIIVPYMIDDEQILELFYNDYYNIE